MKQSLKEEVKIMKTGTTTCVACVFYFLLSTFVSALTFEDMQRYIRENDGVSYAQYNSILRNGYLRWDPSPRTGASFAVYYGSKSGVYTSKKNLPGTITTFALPMTLTSTKYYLTVKEVLGGKEGPAAVEVMREKR